MTKEIIIGNTITVPEGLGTIMVNAKSWTNINTGFFASVTIKAHFRKDLILIL